MVKKLPRVITKGRLAKILEFGKTTRIKKDYPSIVKKLKITEKEYNSIKRFNPEQTKIVFKVCGVELDDFE